MVKIRKEQEKTMSGNIPEWMCAGALVTLKRDDGTETPIRLGKIWFTSNGVAHNSDQMVIGGVSEDNIGRLRPLTGDLPKRVKDGAWIEKKNGDIRQIKSHFFRLFPDDPEKTLMLKFREASNGHVTNYTAQKYDPETMRVLTKKEAKPYQKEMDKALQAIEEEKERTKKYWADRRSMIMRGALAQLRY